MPSAAAVVLLLCSYLRVLIHLLAVVRCHSQAGAHQAIKRLTAAESNPQQEEEEEYRGPRFFDAGERESQGQSLTAVSSQTCAEGREAGRGNARI